MIKNKSKTSTVLLTLILMPIILPAYFAGAVAAILYVTALCGFKNTENFFMEGFGYESNEQILERLMKAKDTKQ